MLPPSSSLFVVVSRRNGRNLEYLIADSRQFTDDFRSVRDGGSGNDRLGSSQVNVPRLNTGSGVTSQRSTRSSAGSPDEGITGSKGQARIAGIVAGIDTSVAAGARTRRAVAAGAAGAAGRAG